MRQDPAVRAALFAFVISRALVFAVLIATAATVTVPETSFPGHVDTTVKLRGVDVPDAFRKQVLTADVNWYVGLAQEGYEGRPFDASVPRNWAFFPVFPSALRAAATVTGEYVLTGIFLSNALFLAALVILHRLCKACELTEADADRSVFYVAFFPLSYFFSVPMTEATFLLLAVATFYAARKGHWWIAGLLGGLASATRVTGVLLMPALAVQFFMTFGPAGWRRRELLSLCLVPAGLLAFMLYLHVLTGNALAFKDVLVAWGRTPGLIVTPLTDYLRDPLLLVRSWDLRVINFAAAVGALAAGAVLLKRRSFALATYALLSPAVALSSGLLQSQARYAMVVFPMFMVLAIVGRRDVLDQAIRVVFIALLTVLTAMYAGHHIAALS